MPQSFCAQLTLFLHCFLSCNSTATSLWSDMKLPMNVCSTAIVSMLSVQIRSSVFPCLCVSSMMCYLNPNASTVSFYSSKSGLVRSYVCMLK